jgi:hypothetical protein
LPSCDVNELDPRRRLDDVLALDRVPPPEDGDRIAAGPDRRATPTLDQLLDPGRCARLEMVTARDLEPLEIDDEQCLRSDDGRTGPAGVDRDAGRGLPGRFALVARRREPRRNLRQDNEPDRPFRANDGELRRPDRILRCKYCDEPFLDRD